MKQSELADQIRKLGGRASRETVSHWENLDAEGRPRSRLTRRNAAVIAQLVRDRLDVEVGEQMFFEPDETAWDALERRQIEQSRTLERLLQVAEGLQRGLDELRRDRTDS